MKQLIDLFNKKYGKQYGVIDDSFSNEDTYKIYKIIKTLCSDDKEIMTVLEKVKLPEPKTAKESIEKININVSGGVGNDNVPHYNETLIFEISGEDYNNLINNQYFNMDALNIDETKSYISKNIDTLSNQEYVNELVYDRENDVLVNEINQIYIYNHKSYNGTNFVEDTNSAVITLGITPMSTEIEGYVYFRLYEVDKVELDNGCLSNDVSIKNSLTVGSRTGVIGECSVAEGSENTASGTFSHAEGWDTTASGDASHAEGYFTTASDYYSHAEGGGTTASGTFSHAEGAGTTASGYASHAEGDNVTVLGNSSHIEGKSSKLASSVIQNLSSSTTNDSITTTWNSNKFSLAKGDSSHVEGFNCLALDNYSHAEGNATQALYQASHAEGTNTVASSICSHAEGYETIASGGYSHAEGSITKATELYSHAEGNYSEASGNASHAEGHETIASGEYSHAEGYKCKSESNSSHAEGCLTEANNFYTHAEGFYTIAKGYSQHVQGKCNIEDTTGKYAHIVGNGESETERSNAHTLDWEGNAWYAGKLTQEGTPTEDKDLATKKYVDEKTASIDTTINNTLPSNGLLTLTTDKIQTTTLAVPTDITLPTVTGYTEIHLFFEGSEGVTITTGTTTVRWKTSPTISTGNLYEIIFTYINDTIGWIGDCSSYNAQ